MNLHELRASGRYVTMPDGHRIWTLRGGPTGATVEEVDVLLHGLGGSSLPLHRCARAVEAAGAPTLLIDLRGHGFSERPDTRPSIDDYVDDVMRVLDSEGVGSANFVGHCLGGIIAMRIAELRPEMVRALVLVATSHRFGRGIRGVSRRYGARATDASLRIAAPHFRVARTIGEIDVSHFPRHTDLYLPRLRQDWAHTSPEFVLSTIVAMCDADLKRSVARTGARTCVVHGNRDAFIGSDESEELARLTRAERLVRIPDDGHASLVLREDSPLPDLVREFLHG